MGTISDKLTYLNTTKSQLKDMINYGLDEDNKITNSTTFRNYVSSIFNAFLEALRTPDTLFTNLPKKSGSGANITLNDTANAPMRIELGASELTQAGTPTPSSPQDIHTISGSNTITINGKNLLNLSYLFSNNEFYTISNNNLISLKGDNRGWGGIPYITLGAGTYTIIARNTLKRVQIGDCTNSSVIEQGFGVDYQQFTLTEKTNVGFKIFGGSTDTYPITYEEPMLLYGAYTSYPEPYKPYVVSQEADIDLGVENYLPTSMAKMISANTGGTWVGNEYTQNNLKIKVNDDLSVVVNGTASAQTTFLFSNNEPLKAGTYVLNGIDGGDIARMYMWDSSWGNITNTTNSVEFTISEDKSIKVGVNLFNGKTFNNFKVEPMISKNGGTYTPYGTTPLEYCKIGNYEDKFIRTSGKNLWNDSEADLFRYISYNNGVYTASDNDDKSNLQYKIMQLQSNGNVIANTTITKNITATGFYYFTGTKQQDANRVRISNNGKSYEFILMYPLNDIEVGEKFTIALNIINLTIGSTKFMEVMLLKGEVTSASYEPYGSNEWYIKKNIGKVVLDGSETYTYNSTYDGFRYINSDMNLGSVNPNDDMICSHFPITDTRGSIGGYPLIKTYSSTSDKIAFFLCDGTSDVNTFKTWLSNNNTTVYFKLATPTYTQITGTLAEQLEYIREKMLSYAGQTNISQVNNDLSFVINASALEEL